MREGPFPNFHDAFTQLHLGQFPAPAKYISRDRRDGGIDQNTDHITRSFQSFLPRVDEDLGIIRIAAYYFGRHEENLCPQSEPAKILLLLLSKRPAIHIGAISEAFEGVLAYVGISIPISTVPVRLGCVSR